MHQNIFMIIKTRVLFAEWHVFLCYLEQNRVTCSNVIPIKTAGRNCIFSHTGETRALIGGGGG